ncbi:hypothetical protein GQ43DRAFT_431251 [Delitschia confertaspora ATCC 74209]|uniref:Uncharacterized protein n=1 Tax=Delitschia confertaspora ATCC 74209 TaxID=1513339 RepID=A0A9P4MT98_9PLEO|nr:hypothetical protein GQ43DRAFT_431251 [Delitschia confertaspora ATCC 74209]
MDSPDNHPYVVSRPSMTENDQYFQSTAGYQTQYQHQPLQQMVPPNQYQLPYQVQYGYPAMNKLPNLPQELPSLFVGSYFPLQQQGLAEENIYPALREITGETGCPHPPQTGYRQLSTGMLEHFPQTIPPLPNPNFPPQQHGGTPASVHPAVLRIRRKANRRYQQPKRQPHQFSNHPDWSAVAHLDQHPGYFQYQNLLEYQQQYLQAYQHQHPYINPHTGFVLPGHMLRISSPANLPQEPQTGGKSLDDALFKEVSAAVNLKEKDENINKPPSHHQLEKDANHPRNPLSESSANLSSTAPQSPAMVDPQQQDAEPNATSCKQQRLETFKSKKLALRQQESKNPDLLPANPFADLREQAQRKNPKSSFKRKATGEKAQKKFKEDSQTPHRAITTPCKCCSYCEEITPGGWTTERLKYLSWLPVPTHGRVLVPETPWPEEIKGKGVVWSGKGLFVLGPWEPKCRACGRSVVPWKGSLEVGEGITKGGVLRELGVGRV